MGPIIFVWISVVMTLTGVRISGLPLLARNNSLAVSEWKICFFFFLQLLAVVRLSNSRSVAGDVAFPLLILMILPHSSMILSMCIDTDWSCVLNRNSMPRYSISCSCFIVNFFYLFVRQSIAYWFNSGSWLLNLMSSTCTVAVHCCSPLPLLKMQMSYGFGWKSACANVCFKSS